MRRSIASILLLSSLGLCTTTLAGCDRPYPVRANINGSEKLPLNGTIGVRGVTTRTLRYGGGEVKKGSPVKVIETWLIRHKRAKPPSYRLTGMYDPTVEAEGFVLPTRAVDTYYLCQLGPDFINTLPVPARFFRAN